MLSPYDGLSIGILSALKSTGYGYAGQPYPIVTGQDAEIALGEVDHRRRAVRHHLQGHPQAGAQVTVKMADAVLKGGKPEVNDTKTYDNGVKVVPSYLLEPVIVDKDNYKKALVDSGYYTDGQLK